MRVLVTGGGTGGHVYPGIAIARRLITAHPDAEVLFVGSSTGPEREAAGNVGIPFEGVPLKGLVGKSPPQRLAALALFVRGFFTCRRLLRRFGATCVVGTGGYAAAPSCFAALTLGVPLILHELNYRPGFVTRMLSRRAFAVACAHAGTAGLLPPGSRAVVTGVAVRPAIERLREEATRTSVRVDALAELELDPDRKTLLIFGGSQGSEAMNAAVWEVLPGVVDRSDIQLLHVTGRRDYSDPRLDEARERLTGGSIVYRVLPYSERMDLLYSVADLAVTRAGAGTIAELSASGLPSVLVPFPYATEGHQESNAREYAAAGAAVVVCQERDSARTAIERALELLRDGGLLARMREAAKRAPVGAGAEGIVALVEELT
jgi:UDP-N-acetylglucosamine--N-acetylmuramyl-(pentapeptide) pyrophosphoryl-undecaprenol N-acetylglucosamine transferase